MSFTCFSKNTILSIIHFWELTRPQHIVQQFAKSKIHGGLQHAVTGQLLVQHVSGTEEIKSTKTDMVQQERLWTEATESKHTFTLRGISGPSCQVPWHPMLLLQTVVDKVIEHYSRMSSSERITAYHTSSHKHLISSHLISSRNM